MAKTIIMMKMVERMGNAAIVSLITPRSEPLPARAGRFGGGALGSCGSACFQPPEAHAESASSERGPAYL